MNEDTFGQDYSAELDRIAEEHDGDGTLQGWSFMTNNQGLVELIFEHAVVWVKVIGDRLEERHTRMIHRVDEQPAKPRPRFLLRVETDDDFAVEFNLKMHTEHEFTIGLDSVEQLDELVVWGAYGSPRTERTKCHEFLEGIERIKANPTEPFNSTGGNRGVEWIVNF